MDRAVGRALFPSPFQGRGHRACRRLGRTASAPAHGALADRSPPAPAPPRCPKRPFTRQPGRHRRRPRRSRFYRSRLYNGPACTPSLRGAQPLATQSGAWLPCTTCTYMHMHIPAHARTCTCTYLHMHVHAHAQAPFASGRSCTSCALHVKCMGSGSSDTQSGSGAGRQGRGVTATAASFAATLLPTGVLLVMRRGTAPSSRPRPYPSALATRRPSPPVAAPMTALLPVS
jgi:hypothetical protein